MRQSAGQQTRLDSERQAARPERGARVWHGYDATRSPKWQESKTEFVEFRIVTREKVSGTCSVQQAPERGCGRHQV